MVSRNYTVQSDKKSSSYQERSPNSSYGKGIHKNANVNNSPKRKENIYHKHTSVGTQYNSPHYKENNSPVNSRYTYSTPHPKCKIEKPMPVLAPAYTTVNHDNYSTNNNIDLKRISTVSQEIDQDYYNSHSDGVQRINYNNIESHYQYSNNVASFNSFNNNSDNSGHSSESYAPSQGYKIRIPLTNTSPVGNGCVNNLPTIAESVVDDNEYPVDVQQDYEYNAKENQNNQSQLRNINSNNNNSSGKLRDIATNEAQDECYCKDTPYGQRTEKFQYISDNPRDEESKKANSNKYKYQGTHPDSLYRVAQLVGHDGSRGGRWFGRTSRLRNLYRLLRWPLALIAVIIALILLIYFLMPETDLVRITTFSNNSADWDLQQSANKENSPFIITGDMNDTAKSEDMKTMNDTTTKQPFEIIVQPETDELNFGYPEDDSRDDEGLERIIKLVPGLGLDPNLFHQLSTASVPLYPKNLSPSVQYGNEHEDAASNEKRHHNPTTENYDNKYFTPTYAIFVNRGALHPTTDGTHDFEEKDGDKFLEEKPQISEPNIDKGFKVVAPRFTSGHQNSFGIPIEEAVNIKSTTQSALYNTRVSPTLPTMVGRNTVRSTTVRSKWNSTEDGICFSTRLSMCRGVLPYDLTTIPLSGGAKLLEATPLLQLLLRSGCSPRARQFLCSLLEPECRPSGMTVLAPCRAACEDIASSCRDVIASASPELSAAFNCSQYPDEDSDECAPLKGSGAVKSATCPSGEIRCTIDGSCVPGHWRCDGISDCPEATDEHGCDEAFCGPNEFKCGENGTCIPEEWVCDGHVDCLPEGSDEHGCAPEGDSSADIPDVQGAASQHPRPIKIPRPPRLQTTTQKAGSANEVKTATEYDTSKELLMMSDTVMPVRKPLSSTMMRKKSIRNLVSTSSRVVTSTSSSISIHRSTLCPVGDSNCKRKILSSRLTPCARGSCSEDRKPVISSTTPATMFNVTQKIEEMEAASGLTSHSSPCPQGELRCVDGRCITLDQLCDHHPDCSDGVDEANCFT